MAKHRKKVYVVNRSSHDFEPAAKYGEIRYLSEGLINRYAVNMMVRTFHETMKDSEEYDYIVPCSLNVMNVIASAIFAHKHGKLNLLLFKEGKYLERNIIL